MTRAAPPGQRGGPAGARARTDAHDTTPDADATRRGALGAGATVPAVVLAGWLLLAVPLLALQALRPLLVLVLGGPLAVAAVVVSRLPARRRRARSTGRPARWPRWPALLVLAAAAALTGTAAATSAEHVLVRRDAGVYALTGQWVAEHGRKSVPVEWPAPTADRPLALGIGSPGFYPRGDVVAPQFSSGASTVLAAGYWLAGWSGLLAVPALAAGAAVLALGGLTARLVGPRWAPLAAGAAAATAPVLLTARSTYSEPFAAVLVLGGLCLLVDALGAAHRGGARARRLAAAAGLVLGAGTAVRPDALREVLLVVPVVAVLGAQRSPLAGPLAVGLSVGCGLGVLDGLLLSRPYLADIAGSFLPLLAAAVLAVALAAGAVVAARRGRLSLALPSGRARRVADLAAAVVLLAGALLAVRPLVGEARWDPDSPAARTVAGIQLRSGVPVDPGRSYGELTMTWVAWYAGWPAVVSALLAAALLARGVVRGAAPAWAPVLLVVLGTTLTTLLRPAITPDHPWAARRLVPVVLPGVALLATAGAAALVRRLRRSGRPVALRRGVTAAAVAVLVVPPLVATAPLVRPATEQGQLDAVRAACAALGPRDTVLLVGDRARREWPQALRSLCGVPAFGISTWPRDTAPPAEVAAARPDVQAAVEAVRAAGRVPVLAATTPEPLARLTADAAGPADPLVAVDAVMAEDARVLDRRPARTAPLRVSLWLARP